MSQPPAVRAVKRAYRVGGERYEVDVRVGGGRVEGRVVGPAGPVEVDAAAHRTSPEEIALRLDGLLRTATVLRRGGLVHVAIDGHVFVLEAEERGAEHAGRVAQEPHAASPMTGTLVKLAVEPGRPVAKGAPLFVVEAMKMEFVVRAPRDVVVGEVRAAAGAKVSLGQVIVTFQGSE